MTSYCIYNIHHFLYDMYEVTYMPGRKFTIYLDEELIKLLKKKAIDEDTSVSKILNTLGWEYVQQENKT